MVTQVAYVSKKNCVKRVSPSNQLADISFLSESDKQHLATALKYD